MKTSRSLIIAIGLSAIALCAACAGLMSRAPAERLFFAVQIVDGDHVVARPQLLGEAGKPLSLRLVEPEHPDRLRLGLELVPEKDGDGYRVQLKVSLPDRAQAVEGALQVLHGEERQVVLADPIRPLTVRLMLMRVASPEFEAWLRFARTGPATS